MIITAHSGCDNTRMNSMEYLKHAVMLDVDAIEIDIRKGINGKLVLGHDTEIGENPVTLKETFLFLKEFPKRVNCDLKEHGIEEEVIREAKEAGMELQKIIFSGSVKLLSKEERKQCFGDTEIYMNIEELVPGIYEKCLAQEPDVQKDILQAVQKCADAKCEIININYHLCNKDFKKLCDQHQIKISAWTAIEKEEIEFLVKMGVYNITTRVPGLVREVLEKGMVK